MISILIAAGVALAVVLLGTPVAIHAFRTWGWGQRIREDGPHTHLEKMGTPTMGGIVILAGFVLGYLASRVTTQRFTVTGVALVVTALGFGVVGFLDDYAKVRRRRSLGLTKAQKFAGTAVVSLLFAWLVMHAGADAGISTHVSFVRPTAIALGVFFVVWAFLVLTGSSNAVNLTDGLDGLAAGSAILVSAAYIFISFWQFRHTCALLADAAGCYGVRGADLQDAAIVAAAMMGAATGFLWWNAAPARIFMGDTGALAIGGLFGALALVTNTVLLFVIIGGLFVLETLSVIAQVISYPRVRPPSLPDVADPPSLRTCGVAGVHGDRAVLDHLRALLGGGDRAVLCGLHRSWRTRMTGAFEGRHVVVLGAGVAGRAAASALLAEGARVRLTDDRDADDLGDLGDLRTLGADVRLGGHRPDDLEGVDLVVTSPGIPPTVPVFDLAAARGVEVWGELELGARLATMPYLAVTGTNGKTTTTGMLASCLRAAGLDAAACGNIGFPFPTAARAGFDALVVEASSFQLERHTTFHPRVSVLLNLAPDHLDHHGAYPAYRDAKARVFVCQGPGDVHIGNADDEAAAAVSPRSSVRRAVDVAGRSSDPGRLGWRRRGRARGAHRERRGSARPRRRRSRGLPRRRGGSSSGGPGVRRRDRGGRRRSGGV